MPLLNRVPPPRRGLSPPRLTRPDASAERRSEVTTSALTAATRTRLPRVRSSFVITCLAGVTAASAQAYVGGYSYQPSSQEAYNSQYSYVAAKEEIKESSVYADDAEVVGIEPSFKIKNGETVHKKGQAQAAQTPYPS